MTDPSPPIRVLIADDEASIREAYRYSLRHASEQAVKPGLRDLQNRLFSKTDAATAPRAAGKKSFVFEPVFCEQAGAAVAEVQKALAQDRPFSIVFLDVRMPPGKDGVWAAARIRELDPAVEIVICTAYSDVDPSDIGGMVPPEEKLSYLQKPFHAHEVRQMAIALESKWRAERRIVRLAYFDTLTGLPNREQIRTRMIGAIDAAQERNRSMAVLYLDLDNFKRVNDTLGHAAGDQLLGVVASRLQETMRSAASDRAETRGRLGDLARLGGDEFMALLPHIREADEAGRLAQRLIRALSEPIELAATSLVVTPSVGIAIYPRDGGDAEALLRNADLAMYFAKRKSPGSFAFFDAPMNAAALQRMAIEDRLRGALERNEFSLEYQPQFDVRTGGISGMEALLRWTNAELGIVPPVEFVPVAEETGLILDIGEWALKTACAHAKAWRNESLPVGRMAVNVAGRQFAQPDFPDRVAAVLRETGLEPSALELEVTESVIMADEEWAEKTINRLKAIGVLIAIDDFGTGYSSFSRLRRFSVDRLKIDRSFVTSINERSDDRAIAAAIITMSRALHINVTAEGVESFPQLMFLQEQDCQDAQGFLLSRALAAPDAHDLLRRVSEVRDGSRSQRLKAIIG